MTEALSIAPGRITHGSTPEYSAPQNTEIPFHLRKSTIKQLRRENGMVPESLWEERSIEVEKRAATIIRGQTDVVSEVIMNPKYTKGSDMVIKLVDGLEVRGEIKSSWMGVRDFKSNVRNLFPELFPKSEKSGQLIGSWVNEIVMSKWLTDNNLLLMNCSESKSDKEILTESFYPQLKRIQQKALKIGMEEPQTEPDQVLPRSEEIFESPGQMILFTNDSLIQVFPEAA